MQRIIVLIFLLSTLAMAAHAESRYVTDSVLIALRPAPNDTARALEMIATGTKVELVEDSGAFLKVKAPSGNIGFARSKYFLPTPPAGGTSASAQLQGELAAVMKQNAELTGEVQRLKTLPTATANAEPSPKDEEWNREKTALILERDQLKKEMARQQETKKPGFFPAGEWGTPFQWLLAGGAILLLGWFAGKSSRSKRRY